MTQSKRSSIRTIIATVVALVLTLTACSPQKSADSTTGTQTLTDALGRTVEIPKNPDRILLGGQRELYTTAILNPDNPLDKIVAWPNDLLENDPDTYHAYAEKFPKLKEIQTTGEIWDNSFSLEQALQTRPQVFVISASSFKAAEEAGIISGFEKAGIPTVVIDYFVEPIKNTVPSIRIMGQLFGQQQRAEEFVKFYESKIKNVTDTLERTKPQEQRVFLWRAPGYFDCCQTFKESNLAKIVTAAGGTNLGDNLLSSQQGTLSPEAVAKAAPDVVIATGANWSSESSPAKPGTYVPLGYSADPKSVAQEWKKVLAKQTVINQVQAVKSKRAYVAWHHFYDSPYNFLAVEWFAQAIHPREFADLEPERDFQELHTRFLPVDANGTFWTGLP